MGIPSILLIQLIVDLEKKKEEGRYKEYVDGIIELIALDSGKSKDEVRNMKDEEFLALYSSLRTRLLNTNMDAILKFFQA